MKDKKLHTVCEVHFQVKMYKTHLLRITFQVEMSKKVHAVDISKSKSTKHTRFGPFFGSSDVEKSARRCGAFSKSNCAKHHMFAPIFGGSDVEKVHAVVARSTFPSQASVSLGAPANKPASSWPLKIKSQKVVKTRRDLDSNTFASAQQHWTRINLQPLPQEQLQGAAAATAAFCLLYGSNQELQV
jgi:hypothetical protein